MSTLDPLVAWVNLRKQVRMDYYVSGVEEDLIETTFLKGLGAPSVSIINPDGDTGLPCVIQLAGDWISPVEITIAWEFGEEGSGDTGAGAYTPTTQLVVSAAEEYVAYLQGNPDIVATAEGSQIHIKSRYPKRQIRVYEATPVYVPNGGGGGGANPDLQTPDSLGVDVDGDGDIDATYTKDD